MDGPGSLSLFSQVQVKKEITFVCTLRQTGQAYTYIHEKGADPAPGHSWSTSCQDELTNLPPPHVQQDTLHPVHTGIVCYVEGLNRHIHNYSPQRHYV